MESLLATWFPIAWELMQAVRHVDWGSSQQLCSLSPDPLMSRSELLCPHWGSETGSFSSTAYILSASMPTKHKLEHTVVNSTLCPQKAPKYPIQLSSSGSNCKPKLYKKNYQFFNSTQQESTQTLLTSIHHSVLYKSLSFQEKTVLLR